MRGAKIKAIRYVLAEEKYSNTSFYKDFPSSEQQKKNLEKIGVDSRPVASEDEYASDLAVKAAEKLFEECNIDRSEIDFLIFCAQEFDYYTPTTACVLQSRLGLSTDIGAFDYNLGCSGFVYGLGMAKGMIMGMGCKNVLLLTSSTLTKMIHPKDKSSRFIFGDGAAATLITSTDLPAIGEFVYGTDGKGYDKIIVKDGWRNKLNESSFVEEKDAFGNCTSASSFFMNGTSVFVFSLRRVPKMIHQLLEKSSLEMKNIDLFVFHQANAFMLETLRKKLDIAEEKFFVYMKNVGNTVSSSIPIALLEAKKEGRLKEGMKVVVAGFGVGLSWSATILDF